MIWAAALAAGAALAQPLVTIQGVQTVTPANLAACNDAPGSLGDTVRLRGVVLVDGSVTNPGGTSVANAQWASGLNTWIQTGTAPFSGIDVYRTGSNQPPIPGTNILDLFAGDSVEVIGRVLNFAGGSNDFATNGGETEIVPDSIILLGQGTLPTAVVISAGDLNNSSRVNQLPTGEQWEGMYVELQNVEVTAVSNFSFAGKPRVSFDVVDPAGNKVNISPRFFVMQTAAAGGTFLAPNVGDKYAHIRGIVAHSPNGCTGGSASNRGYELYPTKDSDLLKQAGSSAPGIVTVSRTPIVPTATQDVTVTVNVQDTDGSVTGAKLFYAVGVSSVNYTPVVLTGAGNTWTGVIPASAFETGDFVKYYVSATDNDNLTTYAPNVPAGGTSNNPIAFVPRDNNVAQIYDIQYTPYTDGNSIYRKYAVTPDYEVTTEGVVTASADANDLGYIFIQQEGGLLGWTGLMCIGNAQLANLKRGDRVRVKGTVREDFGMTRLEAVSQITALASGVNTITPTVVNVDSLTTYGYGRNEPYEGMLVRLEQAGKRLYVVQKNADGGSNFAEYRVGKDALDPLKGCRVLAGRQTSSAFGSLNVSYVNDSIWQTQDGVITVPLCVVNEGDSVQSLTGILYYSFSQMKLLPRNNADFVGFSGKNCSVGVGVEAGAAAGLRVYPNPAHGRLNIDLQAPDATATLTDAVGRTVLAAALGAENALDVSHLPAGLYRLRVVVAGQTLYAAPVLLAH